MRLPFRLRHVAPTPALRGVALLVLALAMLILPSTNALEFKPVAPANLDFSKLGRVSVAGDYSGISLYEFEGQINKPLSSNGSNALYARLPNNVLASVVTSDAAIRALCALRKPNGDFQGVVIGGNFTSLDGTESKAIALFNPNTTQVTALPDLEGEVNAVYCDQDHETVYVGGNFKGANSTNALAWVNGQGWKNLPFAGFNGPVQSITQTPNRHIIFGGSFTGLGNVSTPSQSDDQLINLSTANVTAVNSASTNGFGDPRSIVCSAGADQPDQTWLLQDQAPGAWQASFGFGFEPTKLRLWNTHYQGRGTKTFRFIAFPINGILNLTYVDPSTGQNTTCTSQCPLSQDPNIKYQDFHFVNRVGMNSFQIAISDWYGQGAGLSGVELFQDDIFNYAVSDYNEPTCKGLHSPSTVSATGPWKQAPSLQSNANYLAANFLGTVNPESASVVFFPSIRESGNYSVNLYTPGCKPDGTCDTRGRVNITGTMSSGPGGNSQFSTTLYQTNNFDKYDQIYFGYIEKTSTGFKPSVTLAPLASSGASNTTIAAQRVGFTLLNSTGGLNGLFDFDPANGEASIRDLDKPVLNKLASSFDRTSAVQKVLMSDKLAYIGGNFTSNRYANIVSFDSASNDVQSLDGGLNGAVMDMFFENAMLYAGGDFNGTRTGSNNASLNHVAYFDTNTKTWQPLGNGVNGHVERFAPLYLNLSTKLETALAISGSFDKLLGFSTFKDVPVPGLAIWIPTRKNWMLNLDTPIPTFVGDFKSAVVGLPGVGELYAGAVKSQSLSAIGIASLDNSALGNAPVRLQAPLPPSALQPCRVGEPTDTLSGVFNGLFYDEANITVLAGHFATKSADDGSTINNLVIIDGNKANSMTGLGPNISADSTFTALALSGSTLYAGGQIRGNVNGNQINGLLAYDLRTRTFGTQPAPVGGNGTVTEIAVRPDTADIYVSGSFTKAGALDCPGVCVYNADSDQWQQPGSGFSGNVSSLLWSSKTTLIAGGNLALNASSNLFMASFAADRQSWMGFPGAENIPGPIQAITPASGDGSQVWIGGTSTKDGSVFLFKFDGTKWIVAKPSLPTGSIVRSLQVFSLTQNHGPTEILAENQALMITGLMDLPGFGIVSAAIFNGTDYQPYALTLNVAAGLGSISRIFTSNNNFFTDNQGNLALVFVVLIALAISLALIGLLVIAGILLDRLRKKREGCTPAPTSMHDRESGIKRIPPGELFESLGKRRPTAPHI